MNTANARATARARVRQDKTRILDTGSSRQNETRHKTAHDKPIQDKIRLDNRQGKTDHGKTKNKTRTDKTNHGR